MKLHLASFFEKENHGPGKLISISLDRPNIHTDGVFEKFAPSKDLSDNYSKDQSENQVTASNNFVSNYKKQLDVFMNEVSTAAKQESAKPTEVLPFQDGDTLACWEREGYTNYRSILADYLGKLGYEVELH